MNKFLECGELNELANKYNFGMDCNWIKDGILGKGTEAIVYRVCCNDKKNCNYAVKHYQIITSNNDDINKERWDSLEKKLSKQIDINLKYPNSLKPLDVFGCKAHGIYIVYELKEIALKKYILTYGTNRPNISKDSLKTELISQLQKIKTKLINIITKGLELDLCQGDANIENIMFNINRSDYSIDLNSVVLIDFGKSYECKPERYDRNKEISKLESTIDSLLNGTNGLINNSYDEFIKKNGLLEEYNVITNQSAIYRDAKKRTNDTTFRNTSISKLSFDGETPVKKFNNNPSFKDLNMNTISPIKFNSNNTFSDNSSDEIPNFNLSKSPSSPAPSSASSSSTNYQSVFRNFNQTKPNNNTNSFMFTPTKNNNQSSNISSSQLLLTPTQITPIKNNNSSFSYTSPSPYQVHSSITPTTPTNPSLYANINTPGSISPTTPGAFSPMTTPVKQNSSINNKSNVLFSTPEQQNKAIKYEDFTEIPSTGGKKNNKNARNMRK